MTYGIPVFNTDETLTYSDIIAERSVWIASGKSAASVTIPIELYLPDFGDFAINVLAMHIDKPAKIIIENPDKPPREITLMHTDDTIELRITKSPGLPRRVRVAAGKYT